ncbi:MAG TPA: hypothetical protein PKD70_10585 [Saprospiraceae bacterium]|nr:hypothetical protein [Saprospiraceae bacterium]HMP14317.1 hypothetical protein [Saprospiraceae bacterium]
MDTILEIIKLTVPGLIVFATVYYLLTKYLDHQLVLKQTELKKSQQSTTTPLRLQAYERLSLLCERIALPNLLLRLRRDDATAGQLKGALFLAIQQEYEYNITQQVYVSEQLWEIVKLARDDSMNTIGLASELVDGQSDSQDLAQAIMSILEKRGTTAVDKALIAIKREAAILF